MQGTSLPAYTIFNDETLHLLAATQITSLQDLTRIKGIGPTKLEKFGAALLELLGE
ncbi:MAG: HRDC domain-containing protein [Dehalococcoidia bacterium]